MGLVHGRELLTSPLHRVFAPALALALVAACGGGPPDTGGGAADSLAADAPPAAPARDSAATLVGTLPEGGPMPPAESAGGAPPYPTAKVHTSRAQTAEMRTFEAYTPDDWERVIAYYDSILGPPAWSRVRAEDTVIYQKGEDAAAITVSPWEPELLPPGAPPFVQEAHAVIGVAWRPNAGG